MPEWLYNIEQIIGMPALLSGLISGVLILFLPNQNKLFRITGIVFLIFSLTFIALRFLSDWILINWGLGVPFYGESTFSNKVMMKLPESERQLKMTIHSTMWILTFRVFPIGFLFMGGLLTFLSLFQKNKWKSLKFILSAAFALFTIFFLLTLIEQLVGIKGTVKG